MEDSKVKREINEDIEFDVGEIPVANIMVAGKTGVGKSTLLNAVFGKNYAKTGTGRPITERIEEYYDTEMPIRIWDTVGIELDPEKNKISLESIRKTIAEKAHSDDKYDRIHAIWYCIRSDSSRYEQAEINFINNLHSLGVPFIIVLTKCTAAEEIVDQFELYIRDKNRECGMTDVEVVQVLAESEKSRAGVIESFGIDKLVDITVSQIPHYVKDGFIAAQKVSKEQKRIASGEKIYEFVTKAKEGFWSKVIFVNFMVSSHSIKKMFKEIGKIYNTNLPEEAIEKIIKSTHVTFENKWAGLVNPFYKKYTEMVQAEIDKANKKGLGMDYEASKKYKMANMIVHFGFVFIEAIEQTWEKLTEEELKDIDKVCEKLLDLINEILDRRKQN